MNDAQVATTVTVRLPGPLLARTSQRARVEATGDTVRAVIDSLERDYPGLRFNLCEETGDLRPFVNIFVGGENIRYLSGLDTPLIAGATLFILPSVAGG